MRSYDDNFAVYNDRIDYAKRCHDSLSSGSSIYDCERFADVVILHESDSILQVNLQNQEVNCAS